MEDSGEHRPVFWDPTARRAKIVRATAAVLAAIAAILLSVFLFSLATEPHLGVARGRIAPRHAPPLPHDRRFLAARRALLDRIALDEKGKTKARSETPARMVSGAYYAPWVSGALADFNAHATMLNYIYPSWLAIGPDGGSITSADMRESDAAALTRIARANGVKIVPIVSNASNARFDPKRIALMLRNPERGRAVQAALVSFVTTNGYDGLQIDFEMFDPALSGAYRSWLNGLAGALHARGKELSATLQASQSDEVIRTVAAASDYIVPMAYDEHGDAGSPGPVASIRFVDRTLSRFAALVPSDKLMLGVGAYGYDWARAGGEPQTVTYGEAVALARGFRTGERIQDVIDFDPDALEPTFTYSDENGAGHEVWFLDGVTTANAMQLARSYHVRGATLWALGMEDATTWRAFGAAGTPKPDLRALQPPGMPAFVGRGELLHVLQPPTGGSRTYESDARTGLVTDETYEQIPSNWLVGRTGAVDHKIALTFDDGPDPIWTAQVLDLLKAEHVKATFFVIGENAVAEPDLVRRIFREGHELGNHSFTHPNMAHVGPERVRLELTACQRALESIIGRSVRLFRPPYNADADPSSYGEIFPVAVADGAGYVTAGESIDPEDWDLNVRMPTGGIRRLTAADIEHNVLSQLDRGHAILFHDGGGDRSATVEAVRHLIPLLRARGYEFVTMGALGGMNEQATMPPLSARDKTLAAIDDTIFNAQRIGGGVLFVGFAASIVLGLLRIALMLGLASGRRERAPTPLERPRVDVVIAAYNEETVIADTIASVMQSRNVDFRVIVVNDGSTDRTEAIVRDLAARDGRIVLISKTNGGKASALTEALAAVTAPVMVGIDGDTHIDPDALAALADWFANPAIGAVAGNVQVGNPQNIITRWQAIEYVTSQNMDRRALARLNAITVVPGAIGAWRVEAVRAVGGYVSDTLAEDMDLTWRLRKAGWRIANEPRARAYTEAPATIGALLKQRFRWTYGTLQCLFKHAGATFHYGWFGKFALPSLWLFQIFAQVLAPFVDFELLVAIGGHALRTVESLQHEDMPVSDTATLWWTIGVYLAFLLLELVAGIVAFKLDRGDERIMWLQPLQRLVYRQIMYWVAWRAIGRALLGASQAWGKLRRTGAVAQFDRPSAADRAA